MSNALVPVEAIQKMAAAVAASNLFGVKTADQAMALMLIAQAEGLHPAIAARDYHVIEGKPALKADAMLARFQAAGGKVKWLSLTNEKVAAVFSHPSGGDAEIEWTMEMAKQARLSTKVQRDGGPNMWQKFPRQMLRARVISEGIRTVFPGVAVGVYTPEEVQDFEPQTTMKTVDAEVVIEPKPTPAPAQTRVVAPESKTSGTTAGEWAARAVVVVASLHPETSLDNWTKRNADLIGRLKREDETASKLLDDAIAARRTELRNYGIAAE